MIVVGLTGSIGMGKSTTAEMFATCGVPVWDADQTVHDLYGPNGAGVGKIADLAPDATDATGVNRAKLRSAIQSDPSLLAKIEAAIHPLVATSRNQFLADARTANAAVALCDIPLLFETGADEWLDRILVVTAPFDVQRQRVLERPGMTEATFRAILAKQLPDAEKRARADFVIDTSMGLDHARQQVDQILEQLYA